MAFDPNSGNQVYTVEDLIGLARLGAFGPKSQAVYLALIDLRKQRAYTQALAEENEELRGQLSKLAILNSQVEEVQVDQINKE